MMQLQQKSAKIYTQRILSTTQAPNPWAFWHSVVQSVWCCMMYVCSILYSANLQHKSLPYFAISSMRSELFTIF